MNQDPITSERDATIRVVAALDAAISLLEAGGKKAAPSDRMFNQMIKDYKKALKDAREFLYPDWKEDEDE